MKSLARSQSARRRAAATAALASVGAGILGTHSAEAAIVAESLAVHRARYESDRDAAMKAIAHGESRPSADHPPAELAAWTLVANTVLNLDETLTRN